MSEYNHDEMKRLFGKIRDAIKNREDLTLLKSLLACELANSNLLIPELLMEDKEILNEIAGPNNKVYIPLFTEEEELKNVEGIELTRKPFNRILQLLDDNVYGISINPYGVNCILEMDYLKEFFEVNNEN